MNQRIRELAEQATEWCQENAQGTPVAWEWEDKVVELVIQECINICEAEKKENLVNQKLAWSSEEYDLFSKRIAMCNTIENLIKSKFGVD